MVSNVLAKVEAERAAKCAGLARQLADAHTEKCAREGALEAATTEEKAAKEKFEEAKKALQQAKSASQNAHCAVSCFDMEMQRVRKNSEKAGAEREACKKVVGVFREMA